MKLALIGATGLVGREMIRVLEEMQIEIEQFIPVASVRSAGQQMNFSGKSYQIQTIEQALSFRPDIALFSAGSSVSLQTARQFAEMGCFVIDNSSAWRLHPDVPLVVPEVNIHTITPYTKIIANPNCSTIQLTVVLHPLHQHLRMKKVVISTYQSVTGTGKAAVDQLFAERQQTEHTKVYPHPIDLNCFPFAGSLDKNLFTTEEMKLVNETRKILNDHNLIIEPTVVRIPVIGGHSESVFIEYEQEADANYIRSILQSAPGVVVQDEPEYHVYPMPLTAHKRNEVFVGRIRNGISGKHSAHLWIVADNLRKGAATNAVQIAQYIIQRFLS